jgi:hypothetical protein
LEPLEPLGMVLQVQTEAMAVLLLLAQQQQQEVVVVLHMTKPPIVVALVAEWVTGLPQKRLVLGLLVKAMLVV